MEELELVDRELEALAEQAVLVAEAAALLALEAPELVAELKALPFSPQLLRLQALRLSQAAA